MKNGLNLIIVGVGCAFGAIIRNLFLITIGKVYTDPTAVILVNVIGCFIIGILTALSIKKYSRVKWFLPLLSTGFCGGLTTFSEFADGTYFIYIHNHPYLAISYIIMTMILGMIALMIGLKIILKGQMNDII